MEATVPNGDRGDPGGPLRGGDLNHIGLNDGEDGGVGTEVMGCLC